MEIRGQENDARMSVPSSYGHQSPGVVVDKRRDGNPNGTTTTTVLTYTQTLDQHQYRQSFGQSTAAAGRSPTGSNSKAASLAANVRYRECLRNHAASVGGNIFDGCGEFMPGGEEGTLEALKCAACDCHRNFHRREVEGEPQFCASSRRGGGVVHSLQLPPALPSPTVLHPHQQRYSMGLQHANPANASMVQPMNMAFGGSGGGTESSSEDLNAFQSNAEGAAPPLPYVLSKKRFRTKFTQEQKEKMMEFAEKVGWRINKQDDEEVERFCTEVGVRRQVFKVWMHNNKNLKKQQQQQQQQQQEQQQQQPL